MMDIQVFHAYNNLVAEGKAEPLTCPDCENTFITRITGEGDVALSCVWCNTLVQPGMGLYQKVLSVVKENNEVL